MEITENSLFEAFGMEQPAEAPKDTTPTETEPMVDTETVDTVETETEPDTQPESTEQSADERRQNAARRRQQEQQAAIDKAVAEARADEQAKEYGHSFEREVGFLTVHSMLHLLGYDHMTPDDEKEMFGYQTEILNEMELKR